jgi:uncharacterized protein with HEPN domain
MFQRTHLNFLEDILLELDNVAQFINGYSYEQFAQDGKTVYAVIRALEVMGEATKNLPDEIRDKYPEIPWRSMAGMRDRLIHAYFGVKLEVVWQTAYDVLPTLKPALEQIAENESK